MTTFDTIAEFLNSDSQSTHLHFDADGNHLAARLTPQQAANFSRYLDHQDPSDTGGILTLDVASLRTGQDGCVELTVKDPGEFIRRFENEKQQALLANVAQGHFNPSYDLVEQLNRNSGVTGLTFRADEDGTVVAPLTEGQMHMLSLLPPAHRRALMGPLADEMSLGGEIFPTIGAILPELVLRPSLPSASGAPGLTQAEADRLGKEIPAFNDRAQALGNFMERYSGDPDIKLTQSAPGMDNVLRQLAATLHTPGADEAIAPNVTAPLPRQGAVRAELPS